MTPFRTPWTPIGVYYTFAPYVIADLTIVVYTRSAAVIIIPYVDPVIDFNAVSIRAKIHILVCDVSNLAILDY
jgi:hypothetical protein